MQLISWLRQQVTGSTQNHRPPTPRPRQRRLVLEQLEDRALPSTYYAATASDLIADINAANTAGGANTIVLTAPTSSPYVMTAVNNQSYGPTALPTITSGDQLTILTGNGTANPGYGDTLDAAKNGRLFAIASGASLTLENVTLQNGQVWGFGTPAKGGAIYNQGTLVLNDVMVQNNTAKGYSGRGQDAAGGGIWSSGSLTVENSSVFQGNSAIGSNDSYLARNGGNAFGGAVCIAGGTADITGSFFGSYNSGYGNSALGGFGGRGIYRDGSAYGGALYIAGGTVTLDGDTIGNFAGTTGAHSNIAQGPSAQYYGYGYGGGICVAGGSVTLTNDTIINNTAGGFTGGGVMWTGYYGSYGYGGGIYIASGAMAYLDSFTVAHTTNNHANWYADIDGTYILE